MSQNRAPFWSALLAYQKTKVLPFHTPGHKLKIGPFGNVGAFLGPGIFALDPSDEIVDVESNHDFQFVLKDAERLAAELFEAQNSMFLVNGTTSGLHYLLLSMTGTVLIPRFSHQAVYSGLMLSQSDVNYVPTICDDEWTIPLPPEIEQLHKVVSHARVQSLMLTHPTYYGTVCELEKIVCWAKLQNLLVLVDEAHGAHFLFSDLLPKTGLQCGADVVVQSTHKTLGSFTQTAMLHSQNDDYFSKIVQARDALQTTSPSLVFLANLDEVRRVWAVEGQQIMEKTLQLALRCAEQLGLISKVELLPERLQSDPTKIVFSLRRLGLTGRELERILREDYNIQVELSDYYSVLVLITIGDTPQSIETLVKAVKDLVDRRAHVGKAPLPRYRLTVPELPPIVLSLRQGFFGDKETIHLRQAKGRISGGFLTPYPPGVPVIAPGEAFTAEIIEYILWCHSLNWPIRGLMAGEKIIVLKDNTDF